MDSSALFRHYQELQVYIGWTPDDASRLRAVRDLVGPHLAGLIDDFYEEIERHEGTRKVITGGTEQINRLKGTLRAWLGELFTGVYDEAYVLRRWRVGWRHVEIELAQVYTNVALSRLRSGLGTLLRRIWAGEREDLSELLLSLNRLLDLDLAIIEDAYQAEYSKRQQTSDRLVAIGQVSGGIAHELRNPLNVIKTSAYFLLNARSPSKEKVSEHLVRISDQVEKADGVITALSNFAKLPIQRFEPVELGKLIADSVANSALSPAIEVRLEIPGPGPVVLGDFHQLGIVFGNLIRNARDAMGEGGVLTIRCTDSGDDVRVAVSDTGTGITEADLKRILEPLYTTKSKGIGLGLALTSMIVGKHGGRLDIESRLGVGSTFTVHIPRLASCPFSGTGSARVTR